MYNRFYMRAVIVRKDPEFKKMIKDIKNSMNSLPDINFWFTQYMVCLANTCIALNIESPDFTLLNEYNVADGNVLTHIGNIWLVINKFFPVNDYGFPPLGLWEWILRCVVEEQCQCSAIA